MGDKTPNHRKLLLRAYERSSMELDASTTTGQTHYATGRLLQVAELLRDTHHIGDDPILSGQEWVIDAHKRIAAKLTGQKATIVEIIGDK